MKKRRPQALFGPSVDSLCHPGFATTNISYRFPIFESSATALRGTTGSLPEGNACYFMLSYILQMFHFQWSSISNDLMWSWSTKNIWVVPEMEIRDTPKSSILIGFSTINQSFLGYPDFGKPPYVNVSLHCSCAASRQINPCCQNIKKSTLRDPQWSHFKKGIFYYYVIIFYYIIFLNYIKLCSFLYYIILYYIILYFFYMLYFYGIIIYYLICYYFIFYYIILTCIIYFILFYSILFFHSFIII